MRTKQQRLLKWILFLFTCSISFAVIPGTSAFTHGFFGETVLVSVSETKSQTMIQDRFNKSDVLREKSLVKMEQNLWLILVIAILFLIYSHYPLQLPPFQTIVSLKVRMDD